MIDYINFNEPFDKIKKMFLEEKIIVKEKFVDSFINMLPSFLHYEEESQKIRPSILLCKNIDSLKQLKGIKYKELAEFSFDEFDKRLKAFLLFCINGFTIVFSFTKSKVFCGILTYEPNDGEPLENKLNTIEGFIWITVHSPSVIKLLRSSNETLFVNFSFNGTSECVNDSINLLADVLSGHNTDTKNKYKNLFIDTLSHVHGTIIAVVPHKLGVNNLIKDFDDGIWLSSYINLLDETNHSLKQILLSMLNCDGITIINDNGEIMAFNVFIASDATTNQPGGARKRAFNALIKTKNVIVAFFQSQDGKSDCKQGGYNE